MRSTSHYLTYKEKLANAAHKHYIDMEEKYRDEIGICIWHSNLYGGIDTMPKTCNPGKPSFQYAVQSTVKEALLQLKDVCSKVAVLNFASYKNPGGHFLEGDMTQEESLCHSSYLYNVLSRLPEFYCFNSTHTNNNLLLDRAIYTPDVRFVIDGYSRKVDVLTCAAPNRTLATENSDASEEDNLTALQMRMLFIRNILAENECKTIILGAWGCGESGQEPEVIARLFKSVFLNSDMTVVYAVPDTKTFEIFSDVFNT